jgi:N-acetylmuramoyl-L-alanine amidase
LNNPGATRWYAVQIAATQKVIDTNPSNFKNEKSITRLKVGNINKYVSGKYDSFASAVKERNRLRSKFPDAFVVVVENGIPSLARN